MTEKQSEFDEFIHLRKKGLFLFSLLILGFLGFRFWGFKQNPNSPGETTSKPLITIELEGTVYRPGLLRYPQTTTVQQVIRDGGGILGNRTFSASKGEEVLVRDTTLLVEKGDQGEIRLQQKLLSTRALWIIGRPIPLNRATVEDLDRIPGIGPGLARRIIEYRQDIGFFSSLAQLMEVKGIKEKTFRIIKGYLTL
jgi:competence protein ComEA